MTLIRGAGPGHTWGRHAKTDRGIGIRRRILEAVARHPDGATLRLVAAETGLDLAAVRDQARYLVRREYLVMLRTGGGATPSYRAINDGSTSES